VIGAFLALPAFFFVLAWIAYSHAGKR